METCFAIASWARKYRWTARLLWIIAYATLSGTSLLIGMLSGLAHGKTSVAGLIALLLVATGAAVYYPRKKDFSSPLLFTKQRVRFDLALYLLLAFAWLWSGNQLANPQAPHYQSLNYNKASFIQVRSHTTSRLQKDALSDYPKEKIIQKSWRKKIKKKLSKISSWWSKIRSWKRGYQFLFFIGLSLFTLALAVVLAVISCQLSCSGGGWLAIILFLLTGAVTYLASLFFFAYAFIALFRKRSSYHPPAKTAKAEINS